MKKSFSYNLTQFGGADNTVTEQIKTSDGVKTITTDANTGAVILSDQVDEDSLNPVTGAAVATAIAQGGGSSYTAGDGIDITSDEISVKVDGTSISVNASGELEAIGGGGGSSYTATAPIAIDDNNISVYYTGNVKTTKKDTFPLASYTYDTDLTDAGDVYGSMGISLETITNYNNYQSPYGGPTGNFNVYAAGGATSPLYLGYDGYVFSFMGPKNYQIIIDSISVSWQDGLSLVVYNKADHSDYMTSSKWALPYDYDSYNDRYLFGSLFTSSGIKTTSWIDASYWGAQSVQFSSSDVTSNGTSTWDNVISNPSNYAVCIVGLGTTGDAPNGTQFLEIRNEIKNNTFGQGRVQVDALDAYTYTACEDISSFCEFSNGQLVIPRRSPLSMPATSNPFVHYVQFRLRSPANSTAIADHATVKFDAYMTPGMYQTPRVPHQSGVTLAHKYTVQNITMGSNTYTDVTGSFTIMGVVNTAGTNEIYVDFYDESGNSLNSTLADFTITAWENLL